MNTEIIYFQFKDFYVPFINLESIGFKFFAKIMKANCVFYCSSCTSFNPKSHLKKIILSNKGILKMWRWRNLTLEGEIITYITLALSKVIFLAQLLAMSMSGYRHITTNTRRFFMEFIFPESETWSHLQRFSTWMVKKC